ncbi:hypothetical protein HYV11_01790 [Candidatus Dependentiae bacterium]|nr:hypothetical protein [Candidatus Dependentiae bacterium]
MKLRFLILFLSLSIVAYTEIELEDQGYENTIIGIDEFDTPTSYKIVFSFLQNDPICFYTPKNYQESLDDHIYRLFMPRTYLSPNIKTSLEIEETDHGVELTLFGRFIKKWIGDKQIFFVIAKGR